MSKKFFSRLAAPAVLFAFVTNIPKFMEVEVVMVPEAARRNSTEVMKFTFSLCLFFIKKVHDQVHFSAAKKQLLPVEN